MKPDSRKKLQKGLHADLLVVLALVLVNICLSVHFHYLLSFHRPSNSCSARLPAIYTLFAFGTMCMPLHPNHFLYQCLFVHCGWLCPGKAIWRSYLWVYAHIPQSCYQSETSALLFFKTSGWMSWTCYECFLSWVTHLSTTENWIPMKVFRRVIYKLAPCHRELHKRNL